ncbi:flagellar FliJ family protein [Stieleria sp. JC731]|uniref:flagellar FliJ family protein n=1 Tax=Pirellulaceae TaxID=2691357 RepID=UPI001E4C6231|nr:flagellar FliJ family protein [Stieleria sp. JC731]MCC9601999.1 flagellar FliJ family protein [Stieleria sp. JC731]
MSTQQRLKRTERICKVEVNRLNALIGKRNLIDHQINEIQKLIAELIDQRDQQTFGEGCRPTIEQLTQSHVWIEGLDEKISNQRSKGEELNQKREQMQAEVLAQRTRLRGLEILVDQLRIAVNTEQQTQQFTLADEQAIRDFAEG